MDRAEAGALAEEAEHGDHQEQQRGDHARPLPGVIQQAVGDGDRVVPAQRRQDDRPQRQSGGEQRADTGERDPPPLVPVGAAHQVPGQSQVRGHGVTSSTVSSVTTVPSCRDASRSA
ncbi:hypothetical protein SGRIM128S_08291 [Streptomyces griseomycini]